VVVVVVVGGGGGAVMPHSDGCDDDLVDLDVDLEDNDDDDVEDCLHADFDAGLAVVDVRHDCDGDPEVLVGWYVTAVEPFNTKSGIWLFALRLFGPYPQRAETRASFYL